MPLSLSTIRLEALSGIAAVLVPAFLSVLLALPGQAQTAGDTGSSAETARALVEVLKDETSRSALIDELERIGAEGGAAAPDATPGSEPESEPPADGAESGAGDDEAPEAEAPDGSAEQTSLGRRIAVATQETAEGLAGAGAALWDQIAAAPETFAALDGLSDGSVLFDALRSLVLVIAATYAVFLSLRAVARRFYRRMDAAAGEAGAGRTMLLAVTSSLIDALVVVLAWAAGYAIALLVFGETGEIGLRQTLYLNAFLMVEMAKVLIRLVLSPAAPELRFIDVSNAAAKRLTRVLGGIVALIGYGQLLVVPIVNQQASSLAGRALSSTIAALAVLVAVVMVVRYRRVVADWLTGEGERRIRFGPVRWLAEHWHLAALAYFAWMMVIVVGRPGEMLFPVLIGSAKIALAILAGMTATHAIGRAMSRGVSLPDPVTVRLPLLERRLNTLVPKALLILRLIVFVAVVAVAVDVIGVWDIRGWMESQVGVELSATIVSALLILLAGFIVWLAMSSWVDWRLNPDYGSVPTAREETLLTLFRNAATIAILVVTLMFVLSEIGLNIAPLLASAGVLGLAIGFGAQKMVQDIITGVFIQFENAINVGDVITVGGTTGTVERLTIRSVSLRDLHGTYHIIPFSSVDMVSNFNRGFAYAVMDMGISYQDDIDEARAALTDAFEELRADPEQAGKLLGELEWFGLQTFGDSAVVVRSRIKTQPGQQWSVGRAFNGIVKRVFDERGIEIPFPHHTIFWGEAKAGRTPPLHLSMDKDPAEPDGESGTGGDAAPAPA